MGNELITLLIKLVGGQVDAVWWIDGAWVEVVWVTIA